MVWSLRSLLDDICVRLLARPCACLGHVWTVSERKDTTYLTLGPSVRAAENCEKRLLSTDTQRVWCGGGMRVWLCVCWSLCCCDAQMLALRRSLWGYCPRSRGASTVPRLDRQPSVRCWPRWLAGWQGARSALSYYRQRLPLPARLAACFCVSVRLCRLCSYLCVLVWVLIFLKSHKV